MRHGRPLLLLAAALFIAPVAGAQETPTFHGGQWAAQFYGGNASGGGVLRFFNPTSALLVDVSLSGNSTKSNQSGAWMQHEYTSWGGTLSLGVRRHAALAPRILSFTEFGAQLGTSHTHIEQTGPVPGTTVTSTQGSFNYGVFGGIGGQYFVASHLALGVSGVVQGGVNTGRVGGDGQQHYRTHGWYFGTGLRPVTITLYF